MSPKQERSRAVRAPEPVAARRPQSRIVHGVTLHDDYAWMKADNWQEVLSAPDALPGEIRAYLDDENAYSGALLKPQAGLRRALRKELRGRIQEDDRSPPLPLGPWLYSTRFRKGGEYRLLCRAPRAGGRERILFDGDREARGKAFFSIGDFAVSPDHRLLGWSCDELGSEFHTIRVRDLATGKELDDKVERSDGAIVWTADNAAFYYVRLDDSHRSSQVFRHRLGTDAAQDELVYEELDARWFVHVRRSQSRAFAIVSVSDHDSSESHLLDLSDPQAQARIIEPRRDGVRYDVEHRDDELFIRTNADEAEDFKIVATGIETPSRPHWRDVMAHEPGRMIVAMRTLARHLVVVERVDGLQRIVVRAFDSGSEHVIAMDEPVYHLGLEHMLEFDTDTLRFSYSSMTRPDEIWDYDLATHERTLRKRKEIPSGHDPSRYICERIFATAPDGERVPISLLRLKETTGPAPLLLYAYGAYGYATPAAFSSHRLSLVDRGFCFAIAHVRGGTDRGWAWYRNGKLAKKPNTFSDFIAAARGLIAAGVTEPKKIVAQGGSAGGMLMGAIANQAPELFAGIIADVPFVDVLNTMLDDTLPLTPPEWLEWGNPITDPQAFATIRSYSPYDNVGARDYPAMLILAGLTDPRVTYWEPAKWAARLRATMTGGGPVMLVTNMSAGHGGASGRFDRLDEIAMEQAFALGAVSGAFTPAARYRP
jgi:oligopeptidase B